jgi:hypothetical protein
LKDGVQDISGKDWIDKFGEKITEATGVDITSHEKNKAWVQSTMTKIGVDFDVSGNCYITYGKMLTKEKTPQNLKFQIKIAKKLLREDAVP